MSTAGAVQADDGCGHHALAAGLRRRPAPRPRYPRALIRDGLWRIALWALS